MKLYKETDAKNVSGLNKVYKSIKNNKKKIVIFLGVIILASTIFINTINKPTPNEILNDSVAIVQMHDTDSEAETIKKYLLISEKLNDFMKKYKIMGIESEITEKIETTTLLASDKLEKEIKETEKLLIESNVDQSILVSRVKNLIVQERLVNKYIYNSYDKVNSILEEALRSYAGEKYGIIDTQNISFYANRPERDGITTYRIYYGTFEKGVGIGIESDLKKGIDILDQLSTYKDPDKSDNDKYNKERNKLLKDGLIHSGKLYKIVGQKDLYSEKQAKKIRR